VREKYNNDRDALVGSYSDGRVFLDTNTIYSIHGRFTQSTQNRALQT